VFWVFDSSILSAEHKIVQRDSDTGDKCHHEIEGGPNKFFGKLIKKVPFGDFLTCEDGKFRNLDSRDAERFSQIYGR
jgi:hypothetical protein